MKTLLKLTATVWVLAPTVQADTFTDSVVAKFRDMDFGFVEAKRGPSQLKVEAIKGSTKYEVIYDAATGQILKQEIERASVAEQGRRGVQIDTRDDDFLRAARFDGDDDDDDARRGRGRGSDDDHDDRDKDRSGRGGDDDRDEDRSGRGGDDDRSRDDDGDDNSDRGSENDWDRDDSDDDDDQSA
jgi:hypothetical protein